MDKFDAALALALLVGVALTGQLVGLVGPNGPELLRYAIWTLGYGSVVLTAWYVWIRPHDFRAPGSGEEDVWSLEEHDTPDSEN